MKNQIEDPGLRKNLTFSVRESARSKWQYLKNFSVIPKRGLK